MPPKRIQGQLPTREEINSRNETPPPSYGEIMSNMVQSNQKMSHKIVSKIEFDRLAAQNEKDG